jgi:hypothetical protein
MDKKEFMNTKYFIIKKTKYDYQQDDYSIYDNTMYDVEKAMRKILALDTLNEERERISYHLQKVDLSIAETPLVLTEEVKEDKEQMDMPF